MRWLVDVSEEGRLGHRIHRFLKYVRIANELGFDVVAPSFEPYQYFFEPLHNRPALSYSPQTQSQSSSSLDELYEGILSHTPLAQTDEIVSWCATLVSNGHVPADSDFAALRLHTAFLWLLRLGRRDLMTILEEPEVRTGKDIVAALRDPACRDLVLINVGQPPVEMGDPLRALEIGRSLFTPRLSAQHRHAECLAALRHRVDRIVGVHIRHGDFRDWHGGVNFFDVGYFREAMLATKALFPGQAVRFLVASNEPRSFEEFPGLDIALAPGDLIDDLYLLAECDLVIASPSGYSHWAAQYRAKPVFFMNRESPNPSSLESFAVFNDF